MWQRKFAFVCAILVGFLWVTSARAVLIHVEPDSFPEGTDLRTAFPGITLSNSQSLVKQVLAINGFSNFNGRNLATTGALVFGNPPPPFHDPNTGLVWDEFTFGLLRADFVSPANSVSIDFLFDDDDTGVLNAFDKTGNLLDSVTVFGDGRGRASVFCPPFCDPSATASITRPSADIAYITAGGFQAEALFLDNLQVNVAVVPIPDIFPLFSASLVLLIGWSGWRSRYGSRSFSQGKPEEPCFPLGYLRKTYSL